LPRSSIEHLGHPTGILTRGGISDNPRVSGNLPGRPRGRSANPPALAIFLALPCLRREFSPRKTNGMVSLGGLSLRRTSAQYVPGEARLFAGGPDNLLSGSRSDKRHLTRTRPTAGGPDNLLSESRSDKRHLTRTRPWACVVRLLRLRRPDNKLSGPPRTGTQGSERVFPPRIGNRGKQGAEGRSPAQPRTANCVGIDGLLGRPGHALP
jgi:hypothetical protein